jgi:hypothetical protein
MNSLVKRLPFHLFFGYLCEHLLIHSLSKRTLSHGNKDL